MSSSPWEKLRNGDEDVASPFRAVQSREAPSLPDSGFPPCLGCS